MKDLSNDNIIHVKKNNVEYLQFRRLLEYEDILAHAYGVGINKNYRTARATGKISDEEYKTAIKNYEELCNAIDINYKNIVKTIQKHTDNIMVVKEKENFNQDRKAVDGLCTNVKNNILATTNADCILLMFFDPVKKVIANTHSGWKGTLQRISVKTVDKMQEEYNCNPEDIICCICPSIRKCHFEVEADVKEMYEAEFKDLIKANEILKEGSKDVDNIDETLKKVSKSSDDNKIIVETVKNKKWNIDTVLINKILLQNRGLKKENIIDSQICSVCNKDIIHSYRAERENYGLSTAIITLK